MKLSIDGTKEGGWVDRVYDIIARGNNKSNDEEATKDA